MGKKIKNKKNIYNLKTLLVTVDVGKRKNVGYARCMAGNEYDLGSFGHNMKDYISLYHEIINIREENHLSHIIFGLEPTGSYSEPLIHFMIGHGIEVVQINPMHVKKAKEIRGNSPNKTDEKDPKVIADIIANGNHLSVIIPEGVSAELRELVHFRDKLMGDRTRERNRIEGQLGSFFPEFTTCLNLDTKTAMYLLENYPSPGSIVDLGLEQLSKTMEKVSRKRLKYAKAFELYSAAKASVGVKEGIQAISYTIRNIVLHMRYIQKQISDIENLIKEKLDQVPCSRYILSLRGIGAVIAATLIGETGDFKKYPNANALYKLGGLNLFEISSGKHKGQRRITKRGRSLLRKALYYAALNTVKENGIMYEVYQRHLSKGMKKNKALIAVSRKILALVFALVRDNTQYQEGYQKAAA